MLRKQDIYSFVMDMEQQGGGFSFAHDAPATLDDTYYALRILELLNAPYNNRETIGYIASLDFDSLMIRHLFYAAWTSKKLGIRGVFRKIEKACSNICINNLDELYYKAQLHLLGIKAGKLSLMKKEFNALHHGSKYIHDICYTAIISGMLKIYFDEGDTIENINEFQNHDGGWGFVKGSTSFLENSYIAIKALCITKTKPQNMRGCKKFILRCQANNGGFGRQIITAPSLESTYHAVAAISLLKKDTSLKLAYLL